MAGKVNPDCSNAGNPFHECTATCFERLNSGDVHKKEKKLYGFGKRTPTRETPPRSPAHGSRSPLASFFTKKKVDSHSSISSTDHTNGNFFSRLSPLQGRNNDPANNVDLLPISPSLAAYSGGDYFARRTDQRGDEDDDMSPRPFGTHPKTPEHPLRTPQHRSDPKTPEHPSHTRRPKTPIHESAATGRRPQTPETRPRTAQHRGRSPEFMVRSSVPRSKTPEPQPTYFEPLLRTTNSRSKTPEPSPRIPKTQPISHRFLETVETRPRTPTYQPKTMETGPIIHESRLKTPGYRGKSPHKENISQIQKSQAYSYHESDDESVLLYPELLLSPQERPHSRPITPSSHRYETPSKKEEHFDQLDESASTDDDKFSFVDEHEDNSVWLYPDTTSRSGRSTHLFQPVHHKSVKPLSEQEEKDKPNNKPPELPDETRDKMQSILSETRVSVGDYKVRTSVSATLQRILDKHGDIASTSKLQSLVTRSYYLDLLASVVLELQTTPLKHLNHSRVVEMVAIVRDIESVKIKAGWLKPVLEEIVEAVKHYDEHKRRIMEKEVWEKEVLLARQEMEKQVKELRDKEKNMKEWREGMTEMAGKMGTLDIRRERLDNSLAFLSSKVDKFQGESVLLHGIL